MKASCFRGLDISSPYESKFIKNLFSQILAIYLRTTSQDSFVWNQSFILNPMLLIPKINCVFKFRIKTTKQYAIFQVQKGGSPLPITYQQIKHLQSGLTVTETYHMFYKS